jgi:hypothetical protein
VTPADELILFAPHFLWVMAEAESWHNFSSARRIFFTAMFSGLKIKTRSG